MVTVIGAIMVAGEVIGTIEVGEAIGAIEAGEAIGTAEAKEDGTGGNKKSGRETTSIGRSEGAALLLSGSI